jgi:hypothetical protein
MRETDATAKPARFELRRNCSMSRAVTAATFLTPVAARCAKKCRRSRW